MRTLNISIFSFLNVVSMLLVLQATMAPAQSKTGIELVGADRDSDLVTLCECERSNPFSKESEICFQLSENVKVSIEIKTPLGEPVRSLLMDNLAAGSHTFVWDGNDDTGKPVKSGVYIYEIKANNVARSQMLALL